ncbi:hypothetical protein FJZ17_02030 [Candidatus Pacearchaeota archaeon]|nr:hypothetical protein [Candidatus Pacearchaeota archaeon]
MKTQLGNYPLAKWGPYYEEIYFRACLNDPSNTGEHLPIYRRIDRRSLRKGEAKELSGKTQ